MNPGESASGARIDNMREADKLRPIIVCPEELAVRKRFGDSFRGMLRVAGAIRIPYGQLVFAGFSCWRLDAIPK